MAKRVLRETVCWFCVEEFIQNDMYTVTMPIQRLENGKHKGEYETYCCESCINGEDRKRMLGIKEMPKSSIPKEVKPKKSKNGKKINI